MPRPPNPEVRSRLLSIGREVVLERGFNGSGVGDITTAAGVPKGSFYNYFDSKEAFAAHILEAYWVSIEARHGPMLRDAHVKPLLRIVNFFHAISSDHERKDFLFGCLIGNLSLELSSCSDQTQQRLLSLIRRWEEALKDCLVEAQRCGEIPKDRNAGEIAAILVEAYEGAVMRSKVERDGRACERFEKVTLPLLLN